MNTAAIIGDLSSPKRDHTSVHDTNRRSRYMKPICIAVDEKYALLLMWQYVLLLIDKNYAMRDSNPQPPDSKSDTLSIAPTAL